LDPGKSRLFNEQVVALRSFPHSSEIRVIDKDLRGTGLVRAVLKIVHPPIQQKCVRLGVKKYRGEDIILIACDQCPRR
jgi:hypothetical protein